MDYSKKCTDSNFLSLLKEYTLCKDANVGFTTVPQKLCLIKDKLYIIFNNFETWLLSIVNSLSKWILSEYTELSELKLLA